MFIFSPSHALKGTLATCPGKDTYETSTEGTGRCATLGVLRKPRKRSPFLSSSQRLIVLVGGVFAWASSDQAMLRCGGGWEDDRSFYSIQGLSWLPGGMGVLGTGQLAGLWVPTASWLPEGP